MHIILKGGSECEVFTTLATDDDGGRAMDVERMFNANREETYDPTEAVECEVDGDLRRLKFDDVITMRVRVGTRT